MKNIKTKQKLDIAWSSKGVLTKGNDLRIGRIRQLQPLEFWETAGAGGAEVVD